MKRVTVEWEVQDDEADRVASMIREGLFDLGDGGFFSDTCTEKQIENFDGCDFNIKIEDKT